MRKLILLFSCIALMCNAPLFASQDDDGKSRILSPAENDPGLDLQRLFLTLPQRLL